MSKRADMIIAAVFLAVAVLAAVNTYQLNHYIRETVPRDLAQEQCDTLVIKVLTQWLAIRGQRDTSMSARDDAELKVLDEYLAGQTPNTTEWRRLRDAVAHDRQVRVEAGEQRVPLPRCAFIETP